MSIALSIFGKRDTREPERRSFENPAIPLSDPASFDMLFGGGHTSSSGVKINRDAALSYAAVWRAINLLSRDVGRIPLNVLKRTSDGGKEKDRNHPSFSLLRRQSNEWLSASYFKQILTSHALLHGNGYAEVQRDGNGRALRFVILSPLATNAVVADGESGYVTTRDGVQRAIHPFNMFHLKGLGFDGVSGHSVLDRARETLGMGLAARKFGSVFYRNNARPSVVLQHPSQLSAEAAKRLRDSWQSAHGGLDNTASTAVLEDGMSVQVLSLSAKDSQLIESRQFEIREIASWFGVPPHKLGDTARTSFASLEQENQSYLNDGLDPWLVAWEEEAWLKLLTTREQENDTHLIEFERAAISRTDLKTQTESLVMEVNNGLLTPDEARAIRNRPPIPDGEGAKFRIPANIGVMGEQPDPPASENNSVRGLRNVVKAASDRICKRIAADIVAAGSRENFVAWLDDEFEDRHSSVIVEQLTPIVQALHDGDDVFSRELAVDSARFVFDVVRAMSLRACEVKRSELVGSLKKCRDRIVSEASILLSKRIMGTNTITRCDDGT